MASIRVAGYLPANDNSHCIPRGPYSKILQNSHAYVRTSLTCHVLQADDAAVPQAAAHWLQRYGSHTGSFICGTSLTVTSTLTSSSKLQDKGLTSDDKKALKAAADLKLASLLPIKVDIEAACDLQARNELTAKVSEQIYSGDIQTELQALPPLLVSDAGLHFELPAACHA